VHIGPEPLEQPLDVGVWKHHHVIDGGNRRNDLGPFSGRHHRATGALQRRDRSIIIDCDDEPVGFCGRCLQVANVTDVEQIETAIGKRNGPAVAAVAGNRARFR
jgi:hypothetical protein